MKQISFAATFGFWIISRSHWRLFWPNS